MVTNGPAAYVVGVMMIKLSVVLISKNQAWNMARLVESVLDRTRCVADREIILIDSASDDETVALASRYPIRVLRLKADQHLGPSAGRYVGYTHTTGEFVLFLDGDQELYPGWLEHALDVMQNHPEMGTVTGSRVVLPIDGTDGIKPPLVETTGAEGTFAPRCGGAAMYRRSVLEAVGTFNPFLYSDEEPELCLRIRHRGYRIFQLHHPIVYDYTAPVEALSTKVARWRRNLYLGAGQVIRYHVGDDILWLYLKERGFGLIPALALLAGAAALLWYIVSGQGLYFALWTLLLILVIVADAGRKRSLYRTCVSLVERVCIADGTIRGFLIKPLEPTEYPSRYDVIR